VDFALHVGGCRDIDVMRRDIREKLRDDLGFSEVEGRLLLSPPWTSDWITEPAREKLRRFGLGPPRAQRTHAGGDVNVMLFDAVTCPRCGSANVTLKNAFGPTLCRAMYQCDACKEPFEQFKSL